MFLELGSTALQLFTLLMALGTHRGVPVLFLSQWPVGGCC